SSRSLRMSASEKLLYRSRYGCDVLQLAFPDDKHLPPLLLKESPVRCIADLISFELYGPVVEPRTGYPAFPAIRVLMPEASVGEDNLLAPRKDHIRLARKIFTMQPESISEAVDQAPQ